MNIVLPALALIWLVATILILGVSIGRFEYGKLLDECQRDLPRDQYCELIAVPKEDGGHEAQILEW